MIGLEIPILFLEDYASGGTIFCIVEWGDFIAKTFCYKTYWYIGAVVRTDHRSGIHSFSGFAIDGVFGRTYGHHDGGVAIYDGYSLCFFIEGHFCTEGFSQHANRNHSSPSAVYVWSAEVVNRAIKHFVVDQVLIGTDGHDNIAACVWIFVTEGVGEGICIQFAIVSGYNNANINSTSLVTFEVHGSLTIANVWVNLQINIGFFVTLANDGSGELTINLGDFLTSYNSDIDGIRFTNNALGRVDGNGFSLIVLNNSQFFFYILVGSGVVYFDSNDGTNIVVVCSSVVSYSESNSIFGDVSVDNSVAIDTNLKIADVSFNLQTICIDIFRNNIDPLAKGNLIVDSSDGIVVSFPALTSMSGGVKNEFLNFAEFSNSEVHGYSLLAAIVQSNTYGIFTRNEVLSSAVSVNIYISEGVNASGLVPSEFKVIRVHSLFWLSLNFERVCMVLSSSICCSFISEWARTHCFTTICIGDCELNSIAQINIAMSINLTSIVNVCASEDIAAIFYLFNIDSIYIILNDGQNRCSFTIDFTNGDIIRSSIFQSKGKFKFTICFSSNGTFIQTAKIQTLICRNSQFFTASRNGLINVLPSFTSYSIDFGIAWSNIIFDFIFNLDGIVCVSRAGNRRSTRYIFNSDCRSFNFSRCNVNSDRVNFSDTLQAGLSISSSNTSMNSELFTGSGDGNIQSITIFSSLIKQIKTVTHVLGVCYDNIINWMTVSIFNPYIGVGAKCEITVCAVSIANIKFEIEWFVLGSANCSSVTLIKETAGI